MTNLSLGVLLLPLLGFVILGLFGRFMSRTGILAVAWGACGLAFLLATVSFISMLSTPVSGRVSDQTIYTWMVAGNLTINFGQYYDQLSAVMLMVVTGVGFLIHIYSAGYMEDDPGFWRFFAFLNFFIFAMVLLVTANSYLFLLVGWGAVGLASFLLIGFWYQRRAAVEAAQKAFVINVIGDLGLMLAIFLLFTSFGRLDYAGILNPQAAGSISEGTATAICLLLFVACAAKSAQLPLYMWLPDAMEGPTPVSALIHAATMVTAGVYLVARSHLLFTHAPIALDTVAWIGGITAIFAASIAIFQLDIKRVLAYSTISQLGYMFMGEGAGNFSSGIFHLSTHAYFKALLFLGAGAVIHALGGEQDMRNMGGLWGRMRVTAITFLVAALAISGIFPLSGFWSKDEILGSLLAKGAENPAFYVLWAIGLLTAGLTAFYMFRLFFGIFSGQYRGVTTSSHADEHDESEAEETTGHHAGPVNYYNIHEVPAVMSVPLIILAVLSAIAGLEQLWIGKFLAPSVGNAVEISLGLSLTSTLIALAIAIVGILAAWRLYGKGFSYKENKNPLYQLLLHKYYVDEILDATIVRGTLALGRGLSRGLESLTLDGGSRAIAGLFRGTSNGLRRLQSGYMRNYALGIMLGVVLIIVYYAVRG